MRFEVLGPVTVRADDGTPVPVPEAKVRALLADLLVHRGRPVPVDRLIDDLWGDSVPGNPANTLQTKVSQLRRALAKADPAARALVEFGPAGYALRVDEEAVDAGRFAALTARARRQPDPASRVSLLSQALGLWRAEEAYADQRDAGFAQAAIAGLAEQRLTVWEEYAELRLEIGEHALLADELAVLVGSNPLRQRLSAALMRALYRSGRQSEALTVYLELRERFADELGLDPGPEIAALYEAILRQDPSLAPPAVSAAPSAVPSSTAEQRTRTNLPAPVSSLIGRQDAVGRVYGLVRAGRLVTLTGPGGVGKTRIALAAASRFAEPGPQAFPDGVWLVELAGIRTDAEAVEAVAATFGIRDDGSDGTDGRAGTDGTVDGGPGGHAGPAGRTVEERLAGALSARRTLLLLDNCEQLVEPLAALIGRLLSRAAGLHVLATSQEPLALSGEVLEAVEPLAQSEAMELFAERAAAGAPGFSLGPGNTEAVALICRRLDGIPLALELAATRIRALGVHALADRLHDRFRLLNQVRRDAPARQRTLRAVIDWSWELLTPPERTLLGRLSVFAGGFTLESAESVCAGAGTSSGTSAGISADEVLDLLGRLVDRSLVVPVIPVAPVSAAGPADDATRYRMLESVLAYSRERLEETGTAADIRHRHALHFTELAEQADPLLRGPEQRHWLHRLDTESLNLRAALDTGPYGLRLVNSLTWYWHLRGRIGEAVRSLDLALARRDPAGADSASSPDPSPDHASALARRAACALLAGQDVPPQDLSAADPYARWLLLFARCGFGGPPEREADAAELTALGAEFRALGDRWGEAATLGARATRAMYQGDLPALRRYAESSATLFAGLGDRWGGLQAAEQLGVLAEIAGDYEAAHRLHRDGVRDAEELRLWTNASFGLARLGRIALLTGDDARATEFHERARKLAVEQGHGPARQFAEIGLALGARRRGELEAAEALLLPWLEWNLRLGVDSGAALVLAQLGYAAEQRGDAERALALHGEGLAAARRTGDPRALALALEGLAGAHVLAGRAERAASLLGTAAALRDSVGSPLPLGERTDTDRAAGLARSVLGESVFAAAFAAGREATPEGISA
ncbi:BTAD domain-containing putative transcriptional regulator [Streptomyces sp. NPDC096339]|uniref:BTAD domain-containing putative transcriptional regulator n=1 Tax=Streptomyces sp. NPDC096339 TaxID=3366086 RepID=UPI003818CAB8